MRNVLRNLAFGSAMLASSTVLATPFTETYTGFQAVSEGQKFDFGFDMVYENTPIVNTTSSLKLTTDSIGAPFGEKADWESAILTVGLYSAEKTQGSTSVEFTAWTDMDAQTGKSVSLGTINWDDTSGGKNEFSFNFSDELLKLFQSYGWGKVNIGARVVDGFDNNFAITSVSLLVNTADGVSVPEPASIALLGLGLVGLGLARRRTQQA